MSQNNSQWSTTGGDANATYYDDILFKRMLKDPYRLAIIHKLEARGITPTDEELGNFTQLLTQMKVDEGNKKSFVPRTSYNIFKGSNIGQ